MPITLTKVNLIGKDSIEICSPNVYKEYAHQGVRHAHQGIPA
jgi:hypothetical protein